jgi:hypothetical protein
VLARRIKAPFQPSDRSLCGQQRIFAALAEAARAGKEHVRCPYGEAGATFGAEVFWSLILTWPDRVYRIFGDD